jgi:ubiquitin carboxyl-terminal hydrolase 7
LVWFGLVWFGLVWFGLVWFGLVGHLQGTVMQGRLESMLEGKVARLVKCIDVEFESRTTQTILDLQLSVKRCPDLHTSFKNFCTQETLDGDNKYNAEGHGLQRATMSVLFESLPPVLMLHLIRYEYDPTLDAVVSI